MLLTNRGVMRFQRGQWDAAAADFEQAIALDPKRYNAYVSLGQALRKLGRKGEAIARLGEAIAREPKMAALYRVRALARLDGGRGVPPPDEAEAALGDLETSARLEAPGSRARPRTTPAAAGCCWASIGRATRWPPPTPRWRSPPTPRPRISSSSPRCWRWSATAR